jgi:hypothetical protein
MICKIALKFYLLELLCANGLEFVLHRCNVNTFKTLDPFDMRHGVLSKKIPLIVMVSSLESFLLMHCEEMYVELN